MHLGFYPSTLAAARLTSEFTVFRIGKAMNRGLKSSPTGNSSKSPVNFTEEEFPSLASVASRPKQSKRKTRIDLQTSSKHKSSEVYNNGPLHHEASTLAITNKNDTGFPVSPTSSSMKAKQQGIDHEHGEAKSISTGDQYDTELPPGFWNKRSSSSRNPNERGETVRRLSYSPPTHEGEPFDICLPQTRKTNSYTSPASEKKGKKWENDHIYDNVERDSAQVLRPGMVLFRHYLSLSEQVDIVNKCRELGCGPGGFYRPGYNDGAKLRLHMMCLGLDWNPQTKGYGVKRQHDGAEPPAIPQEFTSLICRVIDDSHSLIKSKGTNIDIEDVLPAMSPDVCIVNYYTTNGRLGLHQDRDESWDSLEKGLPVVSISLGDSAEFLYGDQRDIAKAESVELESGDILIFGGDSRHIFHGVTSILPNTAPLALRNATNLRPGRLNLTFRKY